MPGLHCVSLFPDHKSLSWLAPRLGLALPLAIAADVLFLDAPAPVLALALYLALLAAASFVFNGARARVGQASGQARLATAILTCGLLSLVIDAGALNYGLALVATAVFALALKQDGALRLTVLAPRAAILLVSGPFRLIGDLWRVKRLTRFKQKLFTRAGLMSWITPVVALVVFGALLSQGNPLLERWFEALPMFTAGDGDWGRHVAFCALALALIWPLIHIVPVRTRMRAPETPIVRGEGALLGAAAMTRALILLNALFALQSASDIAFLWGGLTLPEGMSYASYAHRGAYPLVLTALLAAAFVLLAMRRRGPTERLRLIRPLVLAWTGQNILLVISSMFRLKLYVAAYALSELRVYAFVWMALVACGLVLIVAQILRGRSNLWLLEMNARALAAALFAVSIGNIPAVIAEYNVSHCREFGGGGPALDLPYLVSLGPQAIPAFDRYVRRSQGQGRISAGLGVPGDDWRGWSWRSWRLKTYLAQHPETSAQH